MYSLVVSFDREESSKRRDKNIVKMLFQQKTALHLQSLPENTSAINIMDDIIHLSFTVFYNRDQLFSQPFLNKGYLVVRKLLYSVNKMSVKKDKKQNIPLPPKKVACKQWERTRDVDK